MISVITSTYNKDKYLDLTLAGYINQTCDDFEIVIVDDGSIDGTKKIIEKYESHLNIQYYWQENRGIAYARNMALQLAKGNIIIIVDDDRIPCRNFIASHKHTLEENGKTVSIGKQGSIVSHYTPELSFSFSEGMKFYNNHRDIINSGPSQMFTVEDILYRFEDTIDNHFLSFPDLSCLIKMVDKFGDDLSEFKLAWSKAYGGNIAFDRSYLSQAIEYDTNYVGYGGEDVDLSYQLYLQGYKYYFSSNAINYHQEHPRKKTELLELIKNTRYFYDKFPHLETFILKMDYDGVITLDQANSFMNLINKYGEELLPLIKKFIDKGELSKTQ
ncbi:MAG: glycosyltransferase [Clostridiaceae bacterium]|jgi:glycosyltransferase involved in cell wall biosynthesis|nr:glycosyltransferase [Clostridiaceae bacterium]